MVLPMNCGCEVSSLEAICTGTVGESIRVQGKVRLSWNADPQPAFIAHAKILA
jgi:hypothetical protein